MIWALLIGYLIGSLPTADVVSRMRGIDLRTAGTRNPGAANALGLGGRGLAAAVLALDLVKGASAAIVGANLDGDWTAVGAGLAAVAGQIHSPWFRFRGGKGLGVAAGATIVIWPIGLLITLPVLAGAARVLRSSGGTLFGMAWFLGAAALWSANGWSTAWGIDADDTLVWYGIGIVALAAPKFIAGVGSARSKDSDRR